MHIVHCGLVCLTFSCHYATFQDKTGPSFPFGLLSLPIDTKKLEPVLDSRVVAFPDLPPVQERGLASGYAAWKPEWIRLGKRRLKVSNGKPYCWWFKKVRRGDPIIAHRSLPCGTRVYVSLAGQEVGAWVRVGDRGPYGACARRSDLQRLQKRLNRKLTTWASPWCQARYGKDWLWYIKKRSHWPGHYRGIADISHTARRLIGHNGWQNVKLRYWHPRNPPRRVAQLNAWVPGLALSDASDATRDRWGQR